ncbi:MAG: inositol monophosphatase family protein [Solirubrobacteraceae bacterium]
MADTFAPQELLALASEAALAAGDLLQERFGGVRDVHSKSSPTDLVSDADVTAQRAIRELISAARPGDGFLAEEEGANIAGSSGLRWVVDPLDGTVNFLFGIPLWCVSIAVQDAAGTLAGVIYDPLRREAFAAVRGAELTINGEPPSPARARAASLDEALVATGFAYDAKVRGAQAEVIKGLISAVRDIRRCGAAALDLAWTAAGRFDAFFERTVKLWDTAAGTLLCECAGLEVHELVDRPGLPAGVLAAPPQFAAQLLELVG